MPALCIWGSAEIRSLGQIIAHCNPHCQEASSQDLGPLICHNGLGMDEHLAITSDKYFRKNYSTWQPAFECLRKLLINSGLDLDPLIVQVKLGVANNWAEQALSFPKVWQVLWLDNLLL